MASPNSKLFLFGTPGSLGGAATKIRHLLLLLHRHYEITVVLSDVGFLKDRTVTGFLNSLGVRSVLLKDLGKEESGIALVICEVDFFRKGIAIQVKERGLKLVFSNEMMWAFDGEAEAVKAGLIDKVLFVSDFQAEKFAELYRGVPSAITGNYIAAEDFPCRERRHEIFTIGRLSRADPQKFPEDFPVFYEELGIDEIRFRVMAWDQKLQRKYSWHRFDHRWDLLSPNKERTAAFLHSLDLFVYPLGHQIQESWGRSAVEAMLTGCIPIVPDGHQFHNLIQSGETGFICRTFGDYRSAVQELHDHHALRSRMSHACAAHARGNLCSPDDHRRVWIEALTF